VPLFFIALALAEWDEGAVTAHGAVHLVLEEIGYGLVGGVAAGVLGALALRVAARRSLAEPHWLQILTVASALLAAGIATGLGGSIFIAAFTAGFFFGVLRRAGGGEVSYLVDEGGELLNAVTFIVFGAVILGPALDELGWKVLVYAVLSLTVVRMVPVALSLLGSGARRPTLAFVGWFGPRGLATIVFAVIMIDESSLDHERTLLLAVVATIGISVFAHGLSAQPLTNRYVRWYASHPREHLPSMESVPAAWHRSRKPQASIVSQTGNEPSAP
jgi:NhaP-type Na+/H+ or K+/H+ antiporter